MKSAYVGRLALKIEYKTSFKCENTLIPNLYLKAHTWSETHVLHAPTDSTEPAGVLWLRNVISCAIYLRSARVYILTLLS